MKKCLLLLLMSCCVTTPLPPEKCLTRCGLSAGSRCAALQGVEDRAVREFGKLSEWGGPEHVCAALFGWEVEAHQMRPSDRVACKNPAAWLYASGMCVLGYTHEGDRRVEVGFDDWPRTVLAHELVHVIDIGLFGHAGHCAWKERGIKKALKEIQGFEDDSDPEFDCAQ